jgi:hypothetical protein
VTFCAVATRAEKGGETSIADMRAIYHALPTGIVKRFEQVERFKQKDIQLRRRRPTVNLTGNKAVRTWREAFETNNQNDVERIAAERGY